MQEISLKDLLEAGCHFGHKAERWHPKASEFIYQERDGIHVIDLAKTKAGLAKAAEFVLNTAKEGKTVLFVGTKRQAATIVKEEATAAGAPNISHRWIGGFLTNWEQVHANLEKIRRLSSEEKDGTWKKYPKHERVKLSRYLRRLEQFYGGVIVLHEPPAALVVVDIRREEVAVAEAKRMDTPVVGVVDTNSDPTMVQYAVPANDDAVGSVKYLVHYLAEAYKEGRTMWEKAQPKPEAKPAVVSKTSEVDIDKPTAPLALKVSEADIDKPVAAVAPSVDGTREKSETKIETNTEVKPEEKPVEKPKRRGRPKKVVEEVKAS